MFGVITNNGGVRLNPMKTTLSIICIFTVLIISCNNQKSGTPKKYKSIVNVSQQGYFKDSIEIGDVLKKMLTSHLHPFRPEKEFDATTQIFIDSIIYSPDKSKLIVFVIKKNSTNKLLKKENNELYYYNGNFLFCSRDDIDSKIKIYDYAGFNLVNYYVKNDLKERLKEYCFLDRGQEKGKYNIDDIRFWNSDDFNWVINNSQATKL